MVSRGDLPVNALPLNKVVWQVQDYFPKTSDGRMQEY